MVPQEQGRATVRRARSGSQFSNSMAMLRTQGVLTLGAITEEDGDRGGVPAEGRTRRQSQFAQSLSKLKGQWDDAESPTVPNHHSLTYQAKGHEEWKKKKEANPMDIHSFLSASKDDGAGAIPEDDALNVGSFFAASADEPAPSDPSGGRWATVDYPAVVFVCFERADQSVEFPLWGSAEHLEVGAASVTWDSLDLMGPQGLALRIPYDKIIFWTINSNDDTGEYFVDLTMEGDYQDTGVQKTVQWWTGNVLEVRCCTADAQSSEAFAGSIRQVCELIGQVKLEELDLEKMSLSKIAQASRDIVNNPSAQFEDGRTRRISLAQGKAGMARSRTAPGPGKDDDFMSDELKAMLGASAGSQSFR